MGMGKTKISSNEFFDIITGVNKEYFNLLRDTIVLKSIIFHEEINLDFEDQNLSNLKIIFSDDCIFQEDIFLSNLNISNIRILNNCTFLKDFSLYSSNLSGYLKIHKSSFKGEVTFHEIEMKDFSIHKSNFVNLNFTHFKISNGLRINNCNISEELGIGLNQTDSFTYIFCVEDSSNFIQTLRIAEPKNLKIGNKLESKINYVNLFGKVGIGEAVLFENIITEQIDFNGFVNEGDFTLDNVKSISNEAKLLLNNSNLGFANINNCDFSKFYLNSKTSKLNQVSISGTTLPNPENINLVEAENSQHTIDLFQSFKKLLETKGDFISSTKFHEAELNLRLKTLKYSNHKEKKDIYSQLKKMYDQRGDSVKSLEYQAKELDIYRKSITWRSHFFEKLNLSINRFTNNYGTNWGLALFVTIITNAVFFTWYCNLLGFTLDFKGNDFWKLFSYSFEFLNPLRKADFIPDVNVIPGARIVDYSARILVTLCVYQLIQAFRKYGKK